MSTMKKGRKNYYRRFRNKLKTATEKAKKEILQSECDKTIEFQRTGHHVLMSMKMKELDCTLWKIHLASGNGPVEDRQQNKWVWRVAGFMRNWWSIFPITCLKWTLALALHFPLVIYTWHEGSCLALIHHFFVRFVCLSFWVPGNCQVKKAKGQIWMSLQTQLHLVPRLGMGKLYLYSAYMLPWYRQEQLYFYHTQQQVI